MDFTHLNLKQYITEGTTATNNLAAKAGMKTSQHADQSNSVQQDPVRKNMQLKQRSARTGHTSMTDTVDITPSAGPTAESFVNQRKAIERRKLIEKNKIDWRKEIMEAANPDDEPDHPYVEVMPHFKYKEKEAKKNALKAGAKDKASGDGPLKTGVNEENLKAKKDSGKAIPVGKGARNLDNTATPRENVARRVVNKTPDKSKAQKKLIEPMTNDAIADN